VRRSGALALRVQRPCCLSENAEPQAHRGSDRSNPKGPTGTGRKPITPTLISPIQYFILSVFPFLMRKWHSLSWAEIMAVGTDPIACDRFPRGREREATRTHQSVEGEFELVLAIGAPTVGRQPELGPKIGFVVR
jgi:hypothetical protein